MYCYCVFNNILCNAEVAIKIIAIAVVESALLVFGASLIVAELWTSMTEVTRGKIEIALTAL